MSLPPLIILSESYIQFPLISYWLELSHILLLSSKRGWEMWSLLWWSCSAKIQVFYFCMGKEEYRYWMPKRNLLYINLFSYLNILPKITKIMASGPITSRQIDGETMEIVIDFIFGSPKSLQMVTAAMKLKDACSLEEKLWWTQTAYWKEHFK